MVRTKVPEESRDEVVRDQRLVILLTKKERERYEAAMNRHKFRGISDLVREGADQLIEKLDKQSSSKP